VNIIYFVLCVIPVRQRERGREAERQRGREAERQRGREAERQRGREAERQIVLLHINIYCIKDL
jgi:hypothetical protein